MLSQTLHSFSQVAVARKATCFCFGGRGWSGGVTALRVTRAGFHQSLLCRYLPPPQQSPETPAGSAIPNRNRNGSSSSDNSSARVSRLTDAVRNAKRMGLLPYSPAAPVHDSAGAIYRCCQESADNPFAMEEGSTGSRTPSSGSNSFAPSGWAPLDEVARKQAFLAHASQVNVHHKTAMAQAHVNMVHLEGVVRSLEVGLVPCTSTMRASAAASEAEAWEQASRRHTVMGPLPALQHLFLWLDVCSEWKEDEGAPCVSSSSGPDAAAPIAVLCPLSDRMIDQLRLAAASRSGAPSSAAAEVVADTGAQQWFERNLLGQRVILSGQLRMEERFDGDIRRIVQVPWVRLPVDSFRRSIHPVDRILKRMDSSSGSTRDSEESTA